MQMEAKEKKEKRNTHACTQHTCADSHNTHARTRSVDLNFKTKSISCDIAAFKNIADFTYDDTELVKNAIFLINFGALGRNYSYSKAQQMALGVLSGTDC